MALVPPKPDRRNALPANTAVHAIGNGFDLGKLRHFDSKVIKMFNIPPFLRQPQSIRAGYNKPKSSGVISMSPRTQIVLSVAATLSGFFILVELLFEGAFMNDPVRVFLGLTLLVGGGVFLLAEEEIRDSQQVRDARDRCLIVPISEKVKDCRSAASSLQTPQPPPARPP